MAAKAVTVTLGNMAERAQAHIAAGKYSTMSEVVREGLRALDRQEAMLDAIYRAKVAEALANPAPAVPLAEGLAEVRERIARSKGE